MISARQPLEASSDNVREYCYTAEDIERLTGGKVKLKTINNWVTNNYWVSTLQDALPGLARKYSRENVLEAYLASMLAVGGVSRVRAKFYIEHTALADIPRNRYADGEVFYLLKLEFRDSLVDGAGLIECSGPEAVASELKNTSTSCFIFPISTILKELDSLQHDTRGE